MADSSLIDNALVAKLGADVTLLSFCPNGAYFDQSPPKSQRFVVVSLIEEADEPMMGGRAFESVLYLVKAVMLSTANGNIQAAAARIDTLLEDGSLTVAGYRLMRMHRESRVRYTEVDDIDSNVIWFHRGGQYRVEVSTT